MTQSLKINKMFEMAIVHAKNAEQIRVSLKDKNGTEGKAWLAKAIFDQHTALELIIKCILEQEGVGYTREHKLIRLYSGISDNVKSYFEHVYSKTEFLEIAPLESNLAETPPRPSAEEPSNFMELLEYLDNRAAYKERYDFFENSEFDEWTFYMLIPLPFFQKLVIYKEASND